MRYHTLQSKASTNTHNLNIILSSTGHRGISGEESTPDQDMIDLEIANVASNAYVTILLVPPLCFILVSATRISCVVGIAGEYRSCPEAYRCTRLLLSVLLSVLLGYVVVSWLFVYSPVPPGVSKTKIRLDFVYCFQPSYVVCLAPVHAPAQLASFAPPIASELVSVKPSCSPEAHVRVSSIDETGPVRNISDPWLRFCSSPTPPFVPFEDTRANKNSKTQVAHGVSDTQRLFLYTCESDRPTLQS